jgi:GNAT superfamily N-acetyltransferase
VFQSSSSSSADPQPAGSESAERALERGQLRLTPLDENHEVHAFNSGKPQLDDWLRAHALASQKGDLARTFVLLDDTGVARARVVGYFSLVMGHVRQEDAPRKLVRGTPHHPIGVVLVARLALDQSEHGHGLGAQLLQLALGLAVRAGDVAAARLVAVDTIDDDAEAFYRRWGFISLPESPRRLYRRLKDIRRSLDEAAGRH